MESSQKKIKEIIFLISQLNLIEVSELIKEIKSHFNIEETFSVGQTPANEEVNKEKEENSGLVSLKLVELGEKIQVYKLISNFYRELKGEEVSIIKAKELAEKSDKIIFENITREKAKEIKESLEAKSAKVEIKE